jgi:AraC-like DNA-binding protein
VTTQPPAPPPLFISSRIVCRIVAAATARGVSEAELCAAAAIAPAELHDVDARIDVTRYFALWQAAVSATGDATFPLAVAATWGATHNLLRFICMSSANLGEGFERASRYLRVLTNAVSWPLEWREDRMVLAMVRREGAPPAEVRFAEEFGAAEIATLARAFTGAPWDPVELRFTSPEPAHAAALRTFFRAPVRFGCERAEVHVALASLRLPLVKADPATVSFFEDYIDKILRAGQPSRGFVDDVRHAIGDGLRGDAPTLDGVAAQLGTSGRTLRRRLSAEGQSFQGLLDEMRFSIAKEHIEGGRLSLPEISFLLGFSEPSAFHRAFRRWTGTTPQAYARSRRSSTGSMVLR